MGTFLDRSAIFCYDSKETLKIRPNECRIFLGLENPDAFSLLLQTCKRDWPQPSIIFPYNLRTLIRTWSERKEA